MYDTFVLSLFFWAVFDVKTIFFDLVPYSFAYVFAAHTYILQIWCQLDCIWKWQINNGLAKSREL